MSDYHKNADLDRQLERELKIEQLKYYKTKNEELAKRRFEREIASIRRRRWGR